MRVALLALLLVVSAWPASGAETGMVTVIIAVDHMPVEAAAAQARLLLSPGGVALPDERTGRLIVKDFPANVERIRALLKQTDVPQPMVRLAVDYGLQERSSGVIRGGTADVQGEMTITTVSGSEAVIRVGEQVPLPVAQFFFDVAGRIGLIESGVIFQDVSTGFGVVPRVVGGDEVVLRIYPWVSYRSPRGPGVLRFMEAAAEVRTASGQPVALAASTRDEHALFLHILSTRHTTSGTIHITPTVVK